jgi:hypothetical protein
MEPMGGGGEGTPASKTTFCRNHGNSSEEAGALHTTGNWILYTQNISPHGSF